MVGEASKAMKSAIKSGADYAAERIEKAQENAKIAVDYIYSNRSAKALAMLLLTRKRPGGTQHSPILGNKRTVYHRTFCGGPKKRPVTIQQQLRPDVAKIVRNQQRRRRAGRFVFDPI